MARRPWVRYGLALSCVVIVVAATIIAVDRDRTGPTRAAAAVPAGGAGAEPGPSSGTTATPGPTEPLGGPGQVALIDVAVATLWISPGLARPIDRPSLTNPVDVARWVSTMGVADKQWLVGKLATQALYGEPVVVLQKRGSWTKVAVTNQPSSLDPRGYPGWLPAAQLTYHQSRDTGTVAVVTKASTALRNPAAPAQPLIASFNTRLPVISVAPDWTTVATPEGDRVLAASADVELVGPSFHPASGAELVRTAQMFTGLGYLWAGTSGFGFDCSGFTSAVYAAHGFVIPRDANDQATAGSPVAPGQLQPGDLLFFASNGGRGLVHHVAMYVGGGLIIQSPGTGRTVETVPVGRAGFGGEYWGARRYLPPS